jgi:hypothetical protein
MIPLCITCFKVNKQNEREENAWIVQNSQALTRDIGNTLRKNEYDKQVWDIYTAILYHKCLKRIIRVVMLYNPDTREHNFLFFTEKFIDAEIILDYYSARFQIEFLFRDAKQHIGLEECQSRNKKALDFHFNAVMASLNQIKADLYHEGKLSIDNSISIADYKTHENS